MAGGGSRGPFETDSDEDSINTNTTRGSEADSNKEYPVEKLLAQQVGPDGQTKYLVKWEGYPISQCTWESIDSDALLRDWEKEKLAVRRGEKEAFDVDEYNAAYEKWREEVDEKKERRKAKRRRRGQPVAEDEEDFQPLTSSPKGSRFESATPKSKGVAQPVRARRSGSVQSGGLYVSEGEDSASDSPDPLASFRAAAAAKRQKTSPTQKNMQAALATTSPGQSVRRPSEVSKTSAAPGLSKVGRNTCLKEEPKVTGARKSAPPPMTKPTPVKRSSLPSIFGENWAAEKQRKQRVRVSGETPKDSSATKFTRLSIQNRYLKHAQNEPVPDPEALTMVDLKTGKIEPPKAAPSAKVSPAEIPSVYSRRSPVPAPKQRSPCLPRPAAPEGRESEPLARIISPSGRRESTGFQPTNTKNTTCRLWLSGSCTYSAEDCWYAHAVIPDDPIPKHLLTCHFWKSGNCRKPDTECEFAHFDTGVYAGPPGTWDSRRKSVASEESGVKALRLMHSMQPAASADPSSRPLNQTAAPSYVPETRVDAAPPAVGPYVEKKNTTCYYWKNNRRCRKSDSNCEFAHFDTGIYAGAPGTYLESRRRVESHRGSINKDSDPTLAPNPVPAFDGTSHVSNNAPFVHPDRAQNLKSAPSAPVPYGTTEPGKTVETPSFITDVPMTNSPITEVADQMTPRSPFVGNYSFVSPANDPRRQGRAQESAISQREMPAPPRTESTPKHLLRDDEEMARVGGHDLDFSALLGVKKGMIKNVYIHMPRERAAEVQILRKYLAHFNCNVLHEPVAWKVFREHTGREEPGSLVILHPSELFNGTIPKLHSFIMEGGGARVFSVGVQYELCARENRAPKYEALRLFPLGGLTFISDDVFVYYPEKATEIINVFLEQTKNKPPGAENHKIGARPGIKDWMARLAQRKFDEQGGEGKCTDLRWIECYEALCRLCPPRDEDPVYSYHSVPLETSHLWSVWEESMPSFKERWERGDEAGATEYMVNHFAGEACGKVWKYRRFWFVWQRPEGESGELLDKPTMWMEKYCHIGVLPPDQVLKIMKRK